jgi:hypothetical protein
MGRRQSALLLLIAATALVSCKGKHAGDGTIVFGVEAQPAIVSRIGKVHYVAKVGGEIKLDKEIVPKTGETPFPFELEVDSAPGTNVELEIDAYAAGPNNTVITTKPMLVRREIAPFVAGDAKLVRVRLESSCLTGTPGFKGPKCPATQSCSNGRCIDPTLLAEDLENYSKDWAKNRPDLCKPPHAPAPTLAIGTGQTDFVAIQDGVTLVPEKGPQGGHHLWIAVRQNNLRQNGSTVVIAAEQPGTGLKVPPTTFIFPFEPADHGFCKLYGLRLQIDNAAVPVQKFLGEPLDVTVNVRDVDGASAESHVHVNVGATTIGD